MGGTESAIRAQARAARDASRLLARTSGDAISALLRDIARGLRDHAGALLAANAGDLDRARDSGLSPSMIDRLTLTPERVEAMAKGVEDIAALPDPVGVTLEERRRPNGLLIRKVSVPIGVLGMIYESRPNVTIDAAGLCLKSRNAVVLRGGSESLASSLALHAVVQDALERHGLPRACVEMIGTADRAAVSEMLAAGDLIDVMIPRGGKGLIARVMDEATMPVFSHLDGICHIYVHPSAQPDLARRVILNAKMRRTGICGAMETLLLDRALDPETARTILGDLDAAGCALVGDDAARTLFPTMGLATDEDWRTEYLDAKLSVRVVDGVDAAISHINQHGSHHTDSILAEDPDVVARFLAEVDSGIVMHNTSTQFADGGEFGMGAEIGIATGKLHARGPVGVAQLTTYKYQVLGCGQVRPG